MSFFMNRRNFIKVTGAAALSGFGAGCTSKQVAEPIFKISLAEWSINSYIFGDSIQRLGWPGFADALQNDYQTVLAGTHTNLDFPVLAKQKFGIDAIEYVNTCFFDKAEDSSYLAELKKICGNEGVKSLLIMCDAEGAIGDPDEAARKTAVENHYKWVEAAKYLGCHSIRVNASSQGSFEEQQKLAADGLNQLGQFADSRGINVIVENHGGFSSHGKWLAGVMKLADHPRVGTLPDFGNFRISYDPEEWYDRYQGVTELMPFAKAVSAKSQEFDADGNETATDYLKMMKIVLDAGYRGYVGIEYEGSISKEEGINKTKALLERVREKLKPQYS